MSHGYATMSVASILAETAHRMPDSVALIFGDARSATALCGSRRDRTRARSGIWASSRATRSR